MDLFFFILFCIIISNNNQIKLYNMAECTSNENYRKEVIDSLAYLENSSCEVDANYCTECVILDYIRDLETELGFPADKKEDEKYYRQQLAKYRERD